MSKPFKPPVRFTRLREQVNMFFFVAAVAVAGFVVLVAYRQGVFIKHTAIHFNTADAIGINKGMPVKLYGLTVGSVNEMAITLEGVKVQLAINSEYMSHIPKGSRARFGREGGVIGAGVIEIVPPKKVAGPVVPLAAGESIGFERSRGISEIVEEFRRQAAPALEELKVAFAQLNRSRDDIAATLTAVRRETERLPATHDALRGLIEDADRATEGVSQQASAALDSARRAAETVERETPVVAGKLVTALDTVNAAAAQLRDSARQTGRAAQDALRRVEPLLDDGGAAAREARELAGAARRVWPLSGALREAPDPSLPIDSFEAQGAAAPR